MAETVTSTIEFLKLIKDEKEVIVKFEKKDGSMRLMKCTLDFNRIPKDKKPKGIYFVTMETFGLMDSSVTSVASGPYGVFSSDTLPAGTAEGWKVTSDNIFYK